MNGVLLQNFQKKIHRDTENRLHSIDSSLVEWKNKDKNYFIHGVSFKQNLWEQVLSDRTDIFEILKIKNQEQK